MQIFSDKAVLTERCNGKYIFIDNDFLGKLFESESLLKYIVKTLPSSIFLIDPYIELEFRRDVFLPEQRILKEKFVNIPIFEAVPDHPEIYKKIQVNALLLSQIYAHQNENGASLVDLILAGRLMNAPFTSLIITGNRKDYPSCIFDNIAIINLENTNGSAQPFYVISFNKDKFNGCYESFIKLEKKIKI